jgi:hypothetical protein
MFVANWWFSCLLTSIPGPADVRVTDAHDKTGLAIVCGGAVADQVDVDRTAEQYRGATTADARGRRVDTERAGCAIQGRRLPGGGVGHHRGEYLQVTQLGRPGQKVGYEQHAQPRDRRAPGGFRHVGAHPQQAWPGRADLGVRAGAGIQQAKHIAQASANAAQPNVFGSWCP